MKTELKVGDRVRVYTGIEEFKGKVSGISEFNGSIFVIEDGFYSAHNDAPFHPKQLRRLKPWKSKDWWVHKADSGLVYMARQDSSKGGIRVREVSRPPRKGRFVTRESLAKAFEESFSIYFDTYPTMESAGMNRFCKALGLTEEKGE